MRGLIPVIYVAIGGALGAMCRFGLSFMIFTWHTHRWPHLDHAARFPWGTLAVNLLGSFLLGVVGALLVRRGDVAAPGSDFLRYAVAVGFIGSFTTFSTFEAESNGLFGSGEWLLGAAYMAGSVFVGLVALKLGVATGNRFG